VIPTGLVAAADSVLVAAELQPASVSAASDAIRIFFIESSLLFWAKKKRSHKQLRFFDQLGVNP
jgi:hypothetical protein